MILEGGMDMTYFFDSNEEVEFKRLNGRLYLWVIHRDHYHDGMKPHVHILDLTSLSLGETEVQKNLNIYCGMAKKSGMVEPY